MVFIFLERKALGTLKLLMQNQIGRSGGINGCISERWIIVAFQSAFVTPKDATSLRYSTLDFF